MTANLTTMTYIEFLPTIWRWVHGDMYTTVSI